MASDAYILESRLAEPAVMPLCTELNNGSLTQLGTPGAFSTLYLHCALECAMQLSLKR